MFIPRDYQNNTLEMMLLGDPRHVPRQAPRQKKASVTGTGGGKTPVALILSQIWFEQETFTHIFFITPKKQLRGQTATRRGRHEERERFVVPDSLKHLVSDCRFPYVNECKTQNDLHRYVTCPSNEVAAVTAQGFLKFADQLIQMIRQGRVVASEVLLIPDEGHHVHEMSAPPNSDPDLDPSENDLYNKLSDAVATLVGLGVHIYKLTGTAYRSDGLAVIDDTYTVDDTASLTYLMLHGYAPADLVSEVVQMDGPSIVSPGKEGEVGVPFDVKKAVEALLQAFDRDGRVPSVIRVKPGSRENNQLALKSLVTGLDAMGLQPINGAGETSGLEDYLKEEVAFTQYDEINRVLIGIQRVIEGMDSPSRCCGYMLGIPKSFNVLAQFIGRLMRYRLGKYAGYPEQWANTSKVTFIIGDVPNGDLEHSRMVLKTCLFLNSFSKVSLIRRLFDISDGVHVAAPKGFGGLANAVRPEATAIEAELAVRFMVFWRDNVGNLSRELSVLEKVELITQFGRDQIEPVEVNPLAIKQHLLMEAAAENRDVQRRLQEEVRQNVAAGASAEEAFHLAIETVFQEFREQTLVTNTAHLLNGVDIDTFARRVNEIAEGRELTGPKSHENVYQRALAYYEANGRWPYLNHGDDDVDACNPPWTFKEYHSLLKRGATGMPALEGGLPELLTARQPWSWEDVRRDLEDYELRHNGTLREYEDRQGPQRVVFRRLYKNNLVLMYYPHACSAFAELPGIVMQLTLEEADKVGRAIKKGLTTPLQEAYASLGAVGVRRFIGSLETLLEAAS